MFKEIKSNWDRFQTNLKFYTEDLYIISKIDNTKSYNSENLQISKFILSCNPTNSKCD